MRNRFRRAGVQTLLLAGALGTAATASAQTAADAHAVAPLAEQYCFRCHGPQTQTAGIDLATLVTERPLVRNRETWVRVIEALDEGEMPPAGAPPLPPEVRRRMAAMLHRDIEEFDYSTLDDPGFELMRRLTHTEYDNTVRDLFGVALNVTDRFPDELTGSSGFDNSSNTLFLQPALMERYIAAAERVVELALPAEPTDVRHLASRELIFVAAPGGGLGEEDAAEAVLERFLGRAYRRPATAGELDRALTQYRSGRGAGLDHEVAVKRVLQSVLISPKFLLRVERGRAGADPYRVDDWELASRLSYFLWASMPDQELFDLAARGELRDPGTLRAQVSRMLADRRADTLGTVFAAQLLANCATLGSGGSGGVFAPCLYMGAMLGGACGSLANGLLPGWTAGAGAYAMVGMAAFFAAAAKAPTTSILLLFEMTDDYRIVLPLMAATAGSVYVSHRVLPFSVYTLKLQRRDAELHRDEGVEPPPAPTAERAGPPIVA